MNKERAIEQGEQSSRSVWLAHLNYELTAMAELPTWAELLARKVGRAAPSNACVEATLLHARLLIEFLTGRPNRQVGGRRRNSMDVGPGDFLPGWSLSAPERFDDWLRLIDSHLAHLSKRRADIGVAPEGYLTQLVDDVIAAMAEFVSALKSSGAYDASILQAALGQARVQRMKGPSRWPLRSAASQ